MSNGLLLAGNVFINRFDDTGAKTGFIGPINVTKLAVNTPSEEKTRISKQKQSRGQALDTVVTAKPTELEIAMDDAPADILAMALLGEVSTVNIGSGNSSDETVNLPAHGRWVKLLKSNLGAEGLSAKLASDDSVIDVVADIEVNYAAGLVRATPSGTLAAGASIKLSYDFNATAANLMRGGLKPQVVCEILLEGTNLTNGKAATLSIPKASLAPSAAVDFMADEFVSTALKGTAVLAAGETAPFSYSEHSA
ncbi:hypothetical protein [Agarivorans sp. QJM3NY_25]|uniref:phage tail tube protein n=1 Tax=Agarivorans sp. QJM3NY_25 TaxID=3421430 RepID=UPI003D7C3FAA